MKYTNIKVYKTTWCPDCRMADSFFSENGIEVNEVINIDENEFAADEVLKINNGQRSVPTIIIDTEDNTKIVLVEPSWSELLEAFK